ncbi:IS30 family transposase [Teredinibacter waterburyi]|uniref:IS30 family transposase n=1 Tax=Teredinibacter waterburyi TaxID=1500538 RepID=UPI00165F4CB6|nr:IS30 family transposase [Teredinibacter waterburyi]
MAYLQLTYEERVTLSVLKLQGLSIRAIAEILGRHHSTLYRELDRNRCYKIDGAYRPSKAQRRTRARRSRSRRNRHYSSSYLLLVRKLLKQKLSPEQVVGHMRRFKLKRRVISHETIYRYIWQDKADGGDLWKSLRQSSKHRRKRYKAYDSRGRLANKRNIAERPQSIESRKYIGHWEIDTVHGRGSNHCIVTLLERKTGYVMIGKLSDKSTSSLNKKTINLINRYPSIFKTITADNGTEFHQYEKIEQRHNVTFYFANPYHSWERGSNENINGLIRQYLPKTMSMASLTQQQCDQIALKLNQRPRKRFDFITPEEMFYGL